jgi:putative DNA primase/helicase
LRRDKPDLEQKADGTIKEKAKYLSPPGRGNLLYFVPMTDQTWLIDTKLPICITEGEKKTLALWALSWQRSSDSATTPRFLPVGLPGVWNWRGTVGKTNDEGGARRDVKGPIRDLSRIKWDGRVVDIIFDTNVAINPNVRAARRELAKELTRRGAIVRFVDLPQIEGVNGVDDLLAAKGAEFVLGLIAHAKPAQAKVPAGFRLSESGVYAVDPTGEKEDIFICSSLNIVAATRNQNGEEWGRLLEFKDPDGLTHSWAMPMSLLSGDGSDYRSRLLSMGLTIAPSRKARDLLTTYIQSSHPDERVRCVPRVGWHNGAFVLPDETFCQDEKEQILFQTTSELNHRLRISGTLHDWQDNISRYCAGNSRLAFAVSCAFAGPLLSLTGEGGGGFHYRGASSIGKTTAQLVAGSVWGGDSSKGYLQSWRATINGLESVSELHNHGLLCLDEIGQCDPREVGEVAYMLANGMGKARMSRGLTSRRRFEWDLIFLSSGEMGLSDLAESTGKRIRGGQAVRMCDLEVDAGIGLGGFETLHGFPSPADLARHLGAMSKQFYGAPIRVYLSELVNYQEEIVVVARKIRTSFLAEHVPAGASSEVHRAASRFALVGAAGESALGITGWQQGEALDAAGKMFKVWLDGRGTKGSSDAEAAIKQVRRFLEAHGSSRFQAVGDDFAKVNNRVGFRRTNLQQQTEYLVLPESFRKEICSGYDSQTIAKTLAERGYLRRGDGKNLTRYETLPEIGRTRVYMLLSKLLNAEVS